MKPNLDYYDNEEERRVEETIEISMIELQDMIDGLFQGGMNKVKKAQLNALISTYNERAGAKIYKKVR